MALTPNDWTTAAGKLMADKGVSAVKVEVLARELGVSKGSFYWHFKNRGELLSAVIERWEIETDWLIEEANKADSPHKRWTRLFQLIAEIGGNESSIDIAMFLWAKEDDQIMERVKIVEQKRVGYIQELIEGAGFSPEEASHRAEIAYLSFTGYVGRAGRDDAYLEIEKFHTCGAFLIELLLHKEV